MKIDVMLEPDQSPSQLEELAVLAEGYGLRALYAQNYVNGRDPFMSLVPAAQATSKIKLGVCVISPYEQHPMKIVSHCGPIQSVRELQLDQPEKGAEGYLPGGFETAATARTPTSPPGVCSCL